MHYFDESVPISDQALAPRLQNTLEKHSGETDRSDLAHRLGLYRSLLDKLQSNDATLSDSDYCLPCGAGGDLSDNNLAVVMRNLKPACVGNGFFNVRRVDIGLKGDDKTTCSICSEVLARQELDMAKSTLVTLPCMHIFHEPCLVDWLKSDHGQRNWNCPECRAPAPEEMSTYRVHYEEQVQRRLDEYPLSGFCTKCMIWVMERNRNDQLPIA